MHATSALGVGVSGGPRYPRGLVAGPLGSLLHCHFVGGLDDTHPAIAKVQMQMLRRAGCARRAALARSLSRTVIGLSRRELGARMAGASREQVELRWVQQQYGAELAGRLAAFLLARRG